MDIWIPVIVAVIGLAASLFGAGGIVMWFLNRREKQSEERDKHVMDGLRLLIENDVMILKVLRKNGINGQEIEKQEEKMNAFFRKAFI